MPETDRYRDLARKLFAELKASREEIARSRQKIAVVGMAGRFPGGADLASFWERLAAGADLVTKGRPDGLMVDTEGDTAAPWGAYVPDLDRFDAEFFRIAPVEAELMDPQQRLLLETSWAALEDAGLDPGALRGSRTGVYAGIMNRDYEQFFSPAESDPLRSMYVATGNGFAAVIGRVSFALGLQGPAIAVDTACSSSLVAIHQAISGLLRGEADLALAGGVNAILQAALSRLSMTAGMLSPRGRCSTFDAAADGYIRGEGCGVLVLKRLSDAERDGDRILGVVLGSAVNQDGASAGFTVPNGPAQEAVIREALERAGVAGSSVDYLEAHGTGTELGDPIEVRAAAAVYGEGRDPERPLLMGSVKTNIGHLESAAGVAGVIKALLAMRAGVIPEAPALRASEPADSVGGAAGSGDVGGDAVAGGPGSAAARGGEFVRIFGDERACDSGGARVPGGGVRGAVRGDGGFGRRGAGGRGFGRRGGWRGGCAPGAGAAAVGPERSGAFGACGPVSVVAWGRHGGAVVGVAVGRGVDGGHRPASLRGAFGGPFPGRGGTAGAVGGAGVVERGAGWWRGGGPVSGEGGIPVHGSGEPVGRDGEGVV